MQTCTICGQTKPLDVEFFFWRKDREKFIAQCRVCVSARAKRYRESHQKEISEYKRQYYQENKTNILAYQKEYYSCNRERVISRIKAWSHQHRNRLRQYLSAYKKSNSDQLRKQRKKYYRKNRRVILLRNARWRRCNREKLNSYARKYKRHRWRTDVQYRLRSILSTAIRRQLKLSGGRKHGSCLDYLPYSMEELKAHLESQFEGWMSWDNWGHYDSASWNDADSSTWTWQIDHIIPQSRFSYTSMSCTDFLSCWDLGNLQPLSAKANCIKNNNV